MVAKRCVAVHQRFRGALTGRSVWRQLGQVTYPTEADYAATRSAIDLLVTNLIEGTEVAETIRTQLADTKALLQATSWKRTA